ncbi:MerR family transcriptional regulator [Kitasatospora sp. NPDC002040]|uniref:MerR family transcriptional regulator n=1 Tax=Kitasatospora sp. NPDC002040 TaxID=3154661 RepID=UPI003329542F
MGKDYSVGQVAAIAKVTVRTLHHYDGIGLLSPGGRSPAGYRRYRDTDLDRLQQILFYRELGFSLEEIAAILDDRTVSPTEHLRRQHGLLQARIDRLQELAAAVEHAMEAHTMGMQLTPEEKFEVFGPDYQESWEAEAEQRYGGSDAWQESRRRTGRYRKADWERIKAEGAALDARYAAALAAGVAPGSAEGMALAEAHRQQITGNYYDCGYAMHRGLAAMYLADERFTAGYERIAPGLAQWLHDAIIANADARDGS